MAAASSKPPPSSRFGASQEYPLATAASMNSSSRKWVLNSKNEVVDAYHLMNGHYQQQQQHQQQHHQQQHQQQQQQQQQGYVSECGRLMRYNSAPSSLLSDLDQIARSLNDSNSSGNPPAIFNTDLPPMPATTTTTLGIDKRNPLVSDPFSPSTSRFSSGGCQSSGVVSLGMGNVGMDHHHHAGGGFGVDHGNHGFTGLLTGSSTITTGAAAMAGMQATTPPQQQQLKSGNLIRQSSSPASLLSRLEIDQHHAGHHAGTTGTTGTGSSEEDSPNDAMSAEDVIGGMELGGVDFWDGSNSAAVAVVGPHGSFMNSTIRKRIRDEVADAAAVLDNHQQQQQHTLTRHLSLPISSTRSGSILPENLLQDSVPCRLRAKRGCATHPRSIAERVRRTRITERMRKLQELVPNSDKQQTNTSDMLDEAVEYVKFLQRRNEELLQELSDCRDKCQGLCKMSNAS